MSNTINPNDGGTIEADTEMVDGAMSDYDSIYSDDDLASITATLGSSIKKYRYENGRRYHAAIPGVEWIMPNDEEQQDQMDLFHEVYALRLGGRLYLAPIEDKPAKVLDLGTGTGIWCMRFADLFPNARVIGTDVSPIQPEWVPPNCEFEVSDFNKEWDHAPDTVSYVHTRATHGAVDSWPSFCSRAFRVLEPGGWFEVMTDVVGMFSDDGTLPDDSVLHSWMTNADKALTQMGKTIQVQPYIEGWMKDAGFVNVVQHQFKIPIGTWPKAKEEKHLGAMNLVNLLTGLEGFLLAIYTRVLGMTTEEAQEQFKQIGTGLKTKKQHTYFKIHVTYGQKPRA